MEKEKNLSGFTKLGFDIVECAAQAFIVAAILLTFVFMKFDVNGESMLPTLHNKDKVLVYHLFYEPNRGDIVTIDNPGLLNENIIKRVIAKEGDTIKIDKPAGKVYVNGEAIKEDYIKEPGKPFRVQADNWDDMPDEVPQGKLLVLGDNRNGSTDSRSELVKFVNKKDVMGKAFVIYSPFDRLKFI